MMFMIKQIKLIRSLLDDSVVKQLKWYDRSTKEKNRYKKL